MKLNRKGILMVAVLASSITIWCMVNPLDRGPRYPDNSSLEITPGVGIKGVVDIHMGLAAIRRATRDLVTTNYDPDITHCWVPSLGAEWAQDAHSGQRYNYLEFTLLPMPTPMYSSRRLEVTPFKGTVGKNLSCHYPGGLARSNIVAVFGEPTERVDMRGMDIDAIRDAASNLLHRTDGWESMSVLKDNEFERLSYPEEGIAFGLVSNRAHFVSIHGKALRPAAGGSNADSLRESP